MNWMYGIAGWMAAHDMKFNPMKVYNEQRYNNMSLLDKLAVTPIEPSPYYTRF